MKKWNVRKLVALILTLMLAFSLAACSGSDSSTDDTATEDSSEAAAEESSDAGEESSDEALDEYYQFAFSMHTAAESTYGECLQEVFDEIYEKTDGHVEITIYGSATLAAAADVADMVQSGGVDLGWIFTGFYYGEYPLTDVISLPMLGAESVEQGTNVLWDVFEEYPEVFEEWSDYKTLMIYPNPINYIYSSTPVESLEDLQNLSLRAVAGGTADLLTNVGANVITMTPNDIYDAIAKNNIQGFVAEPTMIPDYSLGEVAPYRTNVSLYQATFVVAMNWDAYNSLPAEYQAVIDEYATRDASVDFAVKMDEYVVQCEDDYLSEGNSYVEVSDSVVADFEDAAQDVIDAWIETYTTDDLDAGALVDFVRDAYDKY